MLTSANNPMPFTSMVMADNAVAAPAQPIASDLSSFGRFGDTELVHMSMPEVAAIESEVGELPRNPVTGMREAFWAQAAILAAGAFAGNKAANSAANDQRDANNAMAASEAADMAQQAQRDHYNRASGMASGMRAFDIAGAQKMAIGNYFNTSFSDEGRGIEKQILDNTLLAQSLQTEVDDWKAANPAPQQFTTTKAKSGFFGIGGKAARTIENPDWSEWNKRLNDIVTTKTAEINSLGQTNTELSYKRAAADRSAIQGVQDQYIPMQTAARQQLGDVFSDELYKRQIAATDPLRAHRLKAAQVQIQAQKENYEKMLGQQEAQLQATRGYGGDNLFRRLAGLQEAANLGAQTAATRTAAEGQNLQEIARFNLANEDKKLDMRAEPFRQVGMEMENMAAPGKLMANQANAQQGILAPWNMGPSNYMQGDRRVYDALPSPNTLGWKSAEKMIGQAGNMYTAGQNQTAMAKANTLQHTQNMDLIKEQNKRWMQQPQSNQWGNDWGPQTQQPPQVKW